MIFTTRGYVLPVKTLDRDYLAPNSTELLVLLFESNFVFSWVIPIACACA